ncbi:MAG: hypothetical protein AABZ60_23650 [Planctomycetota bacterium]
MQIHFRVSVFLHFVLFCILLFLLYRAYVPLRYRLSPKIWWRIFGLRGIALFLLFVAVLDPKWVSQIELVEKIPLILLVDASQSMSLPFDSRASRSEKIQSFLKESTEQWDSFQTFYPPIRQGFHRDLVDTETPEGTTTDIIGCLSKIETRYPGNLTDIVLISDGAQTIPMPMPRFPFKIHTIRVCPAVEELPDVRAQRFLLPNRFFVRQPVEGKFLIRATVKKELLLNIQIRFGSETQQIQAVYQGEYLLLPFEFTPTKAGDFLLTAEIQGVPQEQELTNNSLEKRISVQQQGVPILYLENRFRLEQKWLLRTLGQMSALQIDFRLQKNAAALLPNLSSYKVLILGDLKLSKAEEEQVLDYVNQGGGVWLLGAQIETIQTSSLWKNLSPCNLEPLEWISREVFFSPEKKPLISMLPEISKTSVLPIARFLQLGTLKGPASSVLWFERSPLLALMPVGLGRTAVLATDSFYQLLYNSADDSLYQTSKACYEQILRQTILWLANQNESSDIQVDLEKVRFALGEPILVQIYTQASGTFKGKLEKDSLQEEKIFLPQEQTLQATFNPTSAGKYQLQITGSPQNAPLFRQEIPIEVYEENLEKKVPPNPEFLSDLSKRTQGDSFSIEDADQLWKQLELRGPVKITKTFEKRFWDSSLYYLLFFLCLMLEWIQRKKIQLI